LSSTSLMGRSSITPPICDKGIRVFTGASSVYVALWYCDLLEKGTAGD
jgi:hypothetical protein